MGVFSLDEMETKEVVVSVVITPVLVVLFCVVFVVGSVDTVVVSVCVVLGRVVEVLMVDNIVILGFPVEGGDVVEPSVIAAFVEMLLLVTWYVGLVVILVLGGFDVMGLVDGNCVVVCFFVDIPDVTVDISVTAVDPCVLK